MSVLQRMLPAALLLCLGAACGGGSRPADHAEHAMPVTLQLRTADGADLSLAQLRGRPVLLFVFATYDDVSQLALTMLEQFLLGKPELTAVGIAAQPNPQHLLPLYRDSLDVSFELTFEPGNTIVAGGSELGTLETIPTYIVLDPRGHIAARHTGALDVSGLDDLLARALE